METRAGEGKVLRDRSAARSAAERKPQPLSMSNRSNITYYSSDGSRAQRQMTQNQKTSNITYCPSDGSRTQGRMTQNQKT
ncbi:MAG: hypothetical protein F6J93_29345 [Oscillatoria sp. SIO1A7]|nr:hypothetical protein [Oscillatoria sp. SIO1A7]